MYDLYKTSSNLNKEFLKYPQPITENQNKLLKAKKALHAKKRQIKKSVKLTEFINKPVGPMLGQLKAASPPKKLQMQTLKPNLQKLKAKELQAEKNKKKKAKAAASPPKKCQAVKMDGNRCTFNAKPGTHFCGHHTKK